MRKSLLIYFLIGLFYFSYGQQAKMLFEHTEDLELVRSAISKIYNFEFEEGDKIIQQLKPDYQKHPAYLTLMCLSSYQKSAYDIHKDKAAPEYYALLKSALELADDLYKKNPESDEAIFFELVIHGYLAQYHNENKNFLNAMGEGKRTYNYIKKGYKRKESNPEFYLSSGLLDFYIELYPETNPVVKPLMWFFPNGNKTRGIKFFELGAEKGVFTTPECYGYLVLTNLKYERNYTAGLKHATKSVSLYPQNMFMQGQYVEALLLNKEYEKAKSQIDLLLQSSNEFFQLMGHVFLGIYLEEFEKDFTLAEENFKKAIAIGEKNIKVSFDYLSMAYNGFARSYDRKKDIKSASIYYKKSLDIAEYISIKEEAKAYLKENKGIRF